MFLYGRGTENRTLVNRLKAYYFTTKLYLQTTICFADVLYAMFQRGSGRITVYTHSYIRFVHTSELTSAKQMVHLGGIEPAVYALKGHRPNR